MMWRDAVEAVPEGEVLESGWEELGMDDQWAARVATDMADDDNPALPIDFYKVSGCKCCKCAFRQNRVRSIYRRTCALFWACLS